MSKIYIVDKNDNIIGLKERKDIQPDDMYRISCLWLTNSKGEVLIARRALSKSHDPGCWGPAVAGTVEEGEDYETNIIKEIQEELGLSKLPLILGPKILRERAEHKFYCQYYLAQKDVSIKDITIQKDEVEQVKWIKKEELIRDVKKNQVNYVPSMRMIVELFYPQSKFIK